MLGSVTGLNIAASGFVGFDLDDVGPQIFVGPQRIDRHAIAFGPLRMLRPGIMFFENRVKNYGGGHGAVMSEARLYARARWIIRPFLTVGRLARRCSFACWPARH